MKTDAKVEFFKIDESHIKIVTTRGKEVIEQTARIMPEPEVDFSEVKEFFDELVKKEKEKREKPKFLLRKTYLARLEKLSGTKIFQNTFFDVNGEIVDLTKNGALSCAAIVSSFLFMFNKFPDFVWIKEPRAMVESAVRDMESCGWYGIIKPRQGAILVWEPKIQSDGKSHRHIGFYLRGTQAVSNSSAGEYPIEHHFTFGGTRGIEKIYWHPVLDK